MKHGVSSMKHGAESREHGAWKMKHGVWSMDHKFHPDSTRFTSLIDIRKKICGPHFAKNNRWH